MPHMYKLVFMMSVLGLLVMDFLATPAMSAGNGPADGYTIHLQAPHMMADGSVGGPYHHYCKGGYRAEKFFSVCYLKLLLPMQEW